MVLVCPHLGNEKAWNTEPTQREWSLVGRGKKGGGADNELWWKDRGSDGRKIREF